jgi:hypothetical protein
MATSIKSPEDFTADWLTAALTQAGVLKKGRVTNLSVDTIGTGQMGSVVRLTPGYADANDSAPKTLIGKLASVNETSRRTGIALGVYEAEVRFYQQVANTVAMRTPTCWYTALDTVGGWFTLLFEDLGAYETGNVIAGGSVERARLALDQLAQLQSSRWDDPTLNQLPWLADLGRTEALFSQFHHSLASFADAFGPVIDPELIRLAQRVVPRAADYVRNWRGPRVVQHGDYRLDNMLFGRDHSHSPLVVVDWQTVRMGPPLVDAAFYLGAGLTSQERRHHEQELIREYHDKLRAAGVADFSWQQCWDSYRLHALYGFLLAVGTSSMVQQNARGLALYKTSIERHGTHALELDAEAFFK